VRHHSRILWFGLGIALALCGCDDETTDPGTSSSGTGGSGGDAGAGGTTSGTGGIGGDVGGSGGSGGQGGLPDTEGTITISATGLSDVEGDRLIATVLEGSTQLGAVCETIAGNPGSASGVVSEADPQDVCQLGAAVTFQPGTYDVAAGIYPQGEPSPTVCAATTVTVGGNVTVQLTDFFDCY